MLNDPDCDCRLPPGPCALGGAERYITGGGFWAKTDGMRSGNRLLVTKPAGAGAGARSRDKRPARTPPLLVKFHSSKLKALAHSSQLTTHICVPFAPVREAHSTNPKGIPLGVTPLKTHLPHMRLIPEFSSGG